MQSPLVSVIVPVYNGERYVVEAIDSILSQSYDNLEIIVLNDGSTDSSEEKLSHFLKQINYIYQENQGIAGAYNTALTHCAGKYICFLEQDDVWLPEKVSDQVSFLENNPKAGMVYCSYLINDCRGEQSKQNLSASKLTGLSFEELFRNPIEGPTIITFSAVMIRKHVLHEIGPFNQKLTVSVDFDIWLKVAFLYELGFLQQPLLIYRKHDSNVSSNSLAALLDDLQILEDWVKKPGVSQRIGRKAVVDRLWNLCNDIAFCYTKQENNRNERKYIGKMLKLKPFSLLTWIKYFQTMVGKKGKRYISWYYTKIRQMLGTDSANS